MEPTRKDRRKSFLESIILQHVSVRKNVQEIRTTKKFCTFGSVLLRPSLVYYIYLNHFSSQPGWNSCDAISVFTFALKFLARCIQTWLQGLIHSSVSKLKSLRIVKLSEEIGQQRLVATFDTMFSEKNKNLCNSGHVLYIHFCACDIVWFASFHPVWVWHCCQEEGISLK